jgi:hypothetical protein
MISLQSPSGGSYFLFKNRGPLTAHIVSLWVTNSSVHQRYDVDVYLNSGQDVVFQRADIGIPGGQYTVKIVTERGNLAVFSGS